MGWVVVLAYRLLRTTRPTGAGLDVTEREAPRVSLGTDYLLGAVAVYSIVCCCGAGLWRDGHMKAGPLIRPHKVHIPCDTRFA